MRAGENVVVATATASGKSLCYKIPAFENALESPKNRALFLYPTKALAQDQLGKIRGYGLRGVHAATYDGDTPHALRSDIRRRANMLLTNPDMLNVGVLPNHEIWSGFLRNLKLVAVDEAHVLRGVFGSHVAAVLRRLRRVAELHGGDPRFVLTSATIANPLELAESLTGLPFALVDNDGAPSGERRVVFRNPPLLDKEKGERRSLLTEGALVFANLVSQGVRTIAFARTRKGAELIYRYAADRLGPDLARRISPYRAGYTPKERRDIEGRLFRGELLGAVSTSALELGVDVGALEAVVCCGYPGSVASVWQQWGRAGRGKEPSLAVYIPGRDSLDQFLFENPRRILGRRVEAARVTLENPYILGPHLLAAAHEAPLQAEDEAFFGPAYRDVAKEQMGAGALAPSGDRLVYTGGDKPARKISLRSASSETVMIADGEGELIGTAEATRAPSELHPGATYLHRGSAYEVEEPRPLGPPCPRQARPQPLLYASARRDGRRDPGDARGAGPGQRGHAPLGPRPHHGLGDVLQEGQGRGRQGGGGLPAGPAGRDARDPGVLGHLAAAAKGRAPELRELRRGIARRGARNDRAVAPLRDVRQGGHRWPLHPGPPSGWSPDGLCLRWVPRWRRHLPAWIRRLLIPGPRHSRGHRPLPVRAGLPRVRPVPQVRQLERAAEQGGGRSLPSIPARPGEPLPYPLMDPSVRRHVSVVGSGTATGELYDAAREVGRLAAERGWIVVCGGLSGVMEAAARGATEAGGVAIGVLPDEDRARANPYLSYAVATGTGHARNLAVVCTGDAVISIGGEYGTLSEIGLALKVGRPVIALKSWSLGGHVTSVSSAKEAVEAAFELVANRA